MLRHYRVMGVSCSCACHVGKDAKAVHVRKQVLKDRKQLAPVVVTEHTDEGISSPSADDDSDRPRAASKSAEVLGQ